MELLKNNNFSELTDSELYVINGGGQLGTNIKYGFLGSLVYDVVDGASKRLTGRSLSDNVLRVAGAIGRGAYGFNKAQRGLR